jgi:transposase-like protein
MGKRTKYSNEFKLKVVLESMQRDSTIEKVRQRFNIHTSVINRWRKFFKTYAASIFDKANQKKSTQISVGESVEELIAIIGGLTVENQILKKALERLD